MEWGIEKKRILFMSINYNIKPTKVGIPKSPLIPGVNGLEPLHAKQQGTILSYEAYISMVYVFRK